MTTTLQVSTVRQTPAKGQTAIIAAKRQTKDAPKMHESEKARCILVPEYAPSGIPSKYVVCVVSMLEGIARDQLAAMWARDPQLSEVPASAFTEDGLLAFAAAQAESKKLSGDSVAEVLAPFVDSAFPAEERKGALDMLKSYAGTKHAGSLAQCKRMIRLMAPWIAAQDEPHPHAVAVLDKCTARRDELQAMVDATEDAF